MVKLERIDPVFDNVLKEAFLNHHMNRSYIKSLLSKRENREKMTVKDLNRLRLLQYRYSFPELYNKYSVPLDKTRSIQDATNTYDVSMKAVLRSSIGNVLITTMKFGTFMVSGSPTMFAETLHSLVDSLNQGLLYLGLRQSSREPDQSYQYGYYKSRYFWSLVSAMGSFWMGGAVTMYHAVHELSSGVEGIQYGLLTPSVILLSGMIDGYVLSAVIRDLKKEKSPNVTTFQHIWNIKDPLILAVVLEDVVACLGVFIAIIGIGLSMLTGYHFFDAIASLLIGILLAATAAIIIRMNQRYLIGQAIHPAIESDIRKILNSRDSIEAVHSIQSQWMSPTTFMLKAELDFKGDYFSKYLGNLYYYQELERNDISRKELVDILSNYTEDVTRMMEQEIDSLEDEIRSHHPEAGYLELEPSSRVIQTLNALEFRQAKFLKDNVDPREDTVDGWKSQVKQDDQL